jgi:hypothetical protein
MIDPGGSSRNLVFERSGSRFLSAYDGTRSRGYYSAEIGGGAHDQPRRGALVFAVNLPAEESDFAMLAQGEFRDLLPAAKFTFVDASAEAQQLHGALGNEQEIWRPLIWILFVLIGVEFTLATLGGQSKVTNEDEPSAGDRVSAAPAGSWVGRMMPWGRKAQRS